MDIFSWSLPFVAEKVIEMLYELIKVGAGDDYNEDEVEDTQA